MYSVSKLQKEDLETFAHKHAHIIIISSSRFLLLVFVDRYKHLPQPQHKLRFLALQQELLEDFRTRLVQVMKQEAQNVLGQHYCSILNTAYYIVEVLREWSELVVSSSVKTWKMTKIFVSQMLTIITIITFSTI